VEIGEPGTSVTAAALANAVYAAKENGGESCRFSLDLRLDTVDRLPTGVRTCDLHKRWEGSMKFGTIGAGRCRRSHSGGGAGQGP